MVRCKLLAIIKSGNQRGYFPEHRISQLPKVERWHIKNWVEASLAASFKPMSTMSGQFELHQRQKYRIPGVLSPSLPLSITASLLLTRL